MTRPRERDTLHFLPGWLEPVDPSVRQEIRLLRGPGGTRTVTVGRDEDPGADHITLDHPSLRGRHARIHFERGVWSVESMVEEDPVQVNDRVVPVSAGPYPLNFGDRVRIGRVSFDFHLPLDLTRVGQMDVGTAEATSAGPATGRRGASLVQDLTDGRTLIALADGTGGPESGGLASRTALREVAARVRRGNDLVEAIRGANEAVGQISSQPSQADAATTLVAALTDRDAVRLANVGDSRGYVFSSRGLHQITEDHTLEREDRRTGGDPDGPGRGRGKGRPSRALGLEAEVEVDTFGPVTLPRGGQVILCSTGVHGALEKDEMEELISLCQNPRDLPHRLIERALGAGRGGDMTVVTMFRSGPGRSAPPPPSAPSPAESAEGGGEGAGGPGAGELVWDPLVLMSRSSNTPPKRRSPLRWIVVVAAVVLVIAGVALFLVLT